MNIQGTILKKGEPGFEQAILDRLFNKIDPQRRPDVLVLPKTVEDIMVVLKEAKSWGKKISICSGGHSWSANHLRNESILMDMCHFNRFEVNKEQMTAKAGPGVGGSILLTALYQQNLFFPAGHCKGVCLGGYLLQGGFGWNGRKLGMACESISGMDIVTADGELVHANETENADLFWAARGSGSGFFGVVVNFYLKVYPLPKYRGMMMQVFHLKHLESVYNWAYEVGPDIQPAVEFQMLMCRKTLQSFGPSGIEAAAPVFADSKDELHEALSFMYNSPVKHKAFFRSPFFNPGIRLMYSFAMGHYPENHCWGVDNMWTKAHISELMPHLKQIAETLPPPPSHVLWLNWFPPERQTDMAFSMEDNIYISLYSAWRQAKDNARYGNWATNCMKNMEYLSSGIQLADENLHHRTAKFVSNEHLLKLDKVRSSRDKFGLFNTWHSRPDF
ncbi:MAG: FAD-binding oxidoreductase [Sphingobacteriales bacterium]|nr:MAG: FAD-binding oxidoreductase [Sphingobacteriales bacterium]